jgi:hypothetical protein
MEIAQLKVFGLSVNSKYIIYCIGQVVLGALAKAIYLVFYILLIEITSSKYSTVVANINLYMYVVG